MYNLVDLFAGAGGFTAGFCFDLGPQYPSFDPLFRPVLAVDFDDDAMKTYEANFGAHAVVAPIEHSEIKQFSDGTHRFYGYDEDGKLIKKIDLPAKIHVIVGGPPCQGFSPLGRMNDWDREDPRNRLWVHYMKIVEELMPDIFLIENVPQILTSRHGQSILDEAHDLGYFIAQPKILNADYYGVPQKRRRAFILASRIGPIELPSPTFEERTVRDAFGNLPEPETDPLHILRNPTKKSLERYKVIPEGGNRFDLMEKRPDITPRCWLDKKPTGFTDVMGRLWWDKPSLTIRTEFYKPRKGRYLHPEKDRVITHREAAALQTFPNDFVFCGSKIEIARQIGNAVPPILAYHIAREIHDRLKDPQPEYLLNDVPDLERLKKYDKLRQQANGQLRLI